MMTIFRPNEEEVLDRADQKIIAELAANARLTVTDLAKRVGLSKTPVIARVRRLEAVGFITGYHAAISHRKLGRAHVTFVQVSLSDTRDKALQAFNKAVGGIPEIEECHMIAGGFDYLLKVRTSDIQSYRVVLGEKLSELPYVASTSTFVAMESVKTTTNG